MTFFVFAAAAQAESLPALPGTLIYLEGQWIFALMFAGLLGLGVALQIWGVCRPGPRARYCALLGAALVVGAGLFDRDPVLVVGQTVLVAALWPAAAKKLQNPPPLAHSEARKHAEALPQRRSFQVGMGGGE